LDKPSIKITAMSKIEENIPSMDATESHESGKNTVGINLERECQLCILIETVRLTDTIKPRIL
jgi:hypothetical protein